MPNLLAADLACIMADTSLFVPVVYGAIRGNGRYHDEEVQQLDGEGGIVLAHQRSVVVDATCFASITRDSSIVVDGTSYTVRDMRLEAGGTLMRVILV